MSAVAGCCQAVGRFAFAVTGSGGEAA